MLYTNPEIQSSFQKNDLGQTLYDLVLAMKPQRIVEFGVLHGYSTVAMAMALHELGRGKIISYDIWDGPQRHGKLHECMWEVMSRGLGRFVEFKHGDFWRTEPSKADMYVIDISNDGAVVKEAYKRFHEHGTLVFEGGSPERDTVEWMKKFKKKPISTCGVPYKIINEKFPSISIA